jgi:hypothetical protein
MKLRLFENFQENPNEFTDKIGRNQVEVNLYDEPSEIKYCSVQEGRVTWTLDLTYKSWGIELDGAKIKEMYFDVETEDEETGDYVTTSIEVPEGSTSFDVIQYEIGEFPLSLQSIEIYMNHTMDPEFWKVTMYIGQIN